MYLQKRFMNEPRGGFIKEVSVKETIDINNPEDFKMAELFLDYN